MPQDKTPIEHRDDESRRQTWERPEVRSVRAGDAESGAGATTEFLTGSS